AMPSPTPAHATEFRPQPQPTRAYTSDIQPQRPQPTANVATTMSASRPGNAQTAMVGVVIVEGSQARQRPIQAVLQQPVPAPAASVRAPAPAASLARASVTSAAATQVQAQPAGPFSLGEYARRLREKKQQR